jgi:hypothetical protein
MASDVVTSAPENRDDIGFNIGCGARKNRVAAKRDRCGATTGVPKLRWVFAVVRQQLSARRFLGRLPEGAGGAVSYKSMKKFFRFTLGDGENHSLKIQGRRSGDYRRCSRLLNCNRGLTFEG